MELDIKFTCGEDKTYPQNNNGVKTEEEEKEKKTLVTLIDLIDSPTAKQSSGCFSLNLFCSCLK